MIRILLVAIALYFFFRLIGRIVQSLGSPPANFPREKDITRQAKIIEESDEK